jgi:hypothetical protein
MSARPEAAALWAEEVVGAEVPRQEAAAQDAPVPLAAAVVSQDAAARPREAAAARHGAAVAQLGAAAVEEAQPGVVVVAAEPRDGVVAAARVARRVGPGAPAVAQPSVAAWAFLLLPWPGP